MKVLVMGDEESLSSFPVKKCIIGLIKTLKKVSMTT